MYFAFTSPQKQCSIELVGIWCVMLGRNYTMEINESVLIEVQAELAAAKIELERLKQLSFSSELKAERIKSLKQEIQQVERLLKERADS